jgi:hypothetical protein
LEQLLEGQQWNWHIKKSIRAISTSFFFESRLSADRNNFPSLGIGAW